MSLDISAIILAAGKSTRMGKPKMLLPWGDKTTILGKVISIFSSVEIRDIIVVTGGDKTLVEGEVERLRDFFPVRAVYNPFFDSGGMLSSIQTGLKAVSQDAVAVMLGLGDQPQIETATAKKLIEEYARVRQGIIAPSHDHRRGHPILMDAVIAQQLLHFDTSLSLKLFLTQHNDAISYVESGPSVLLDVDTMDDYKRYNKKD
jgi:molybdenum cofactor cytidylyltransferase